MPDGTEYDFRSNAFVKRRRYRLTDDALTWEEEGKPLDGVFYDDISEIRLAFAPMRIATNRYRAQIIFRQGGMAELFNTDFVGFANLKEQNEEYSAFIRELHRRIAERNAPTAFRTGNSVGGYIANLLLMVFIAFMLVLIFILLINIGLGPVAFVKLAIILYFLPTAIRYIQRARPGTYDPRAIPDAILPASAPAPGNSSAPA